MPPAEATMRWRLGIFYDTALQFAMGLERAEISKALGLSVRTIDSRRREILEILGVRNNVALARLFIREGLVKP